MTRLLRADEAESRREELYGLVYDELHAIARGRMRAERAGHTLQATALVNEAYLRLVADQDMEWKGRRHFYAAAAEAMRRILVDHARKVRSKKRGGDQLRVTLGAGDVAAELDLEQVLGVHEALGRLERDDPLAAEVTRLRFFSGLSVEETAEALDISVRTLQREWAYARARLVELWGA